jgi:hypothetical protein
MALIPVEACPAIPHIEHDQSPQLQNLFSISTEDSTPNISLHPLLDYNKAKVNIHILHLYKSHDRYDDFQPPKPRQVRPRIQNQIQALGGVSQLLHSYCHLCLESVRAEIGNGFADAVGGGAGDWECGAVAVEFGC